MSKDSAASTYHYTECAVAYLDIVGFKDRISKSSTDEGIIKSIAEAFSQVQAWLKTFRDNALHIQTHMFSDSVFVSCSDSTEHSLMTMIAGITMLQNALVPYGFHLTGCLAAGLVYQEGPMMFGPAMVEAYRTERLARWPRVIVAASALQRLRVHLPPTGGAPYFLCREDDGLTYVDYLTQGCLIGTARSVGRAVFWQISRISAQMAYSLVSCIITRIQFCPPPVAMQPSISTYCQSAMLLPSTITGPSGVSRVHLVRIPSPVLTWITSSPLRREWLNLPNRQRQKVLSNPSPRSWPCCVQFPDNLGSTSLTCPWPSPACTDYHRISRHSGGWHGRSGDYPRDHGYMLPSDISLKPWHTIRTNTTAARSA